MGAWAEFFLAVAKQAGITKGGGISMAVLGIFPPENGQLLMAGKDWSVGGNPLKDRKDFPEKSDDIVSIDSRVKVGDDIWIRGMSKTNKIVNDKRTPAQNIDKPTATLFPNHAIVLIKVGSSEVYVFDPSYGITSKSAKINNDMSIRDLVLKKDPAVQEALVNYENMAIGGFVQVGSATPGKGVQNYPLKAKRLSSEGPDPVVRVRIESILEKGVLK